MAKQVKFYSVASLPANADAGALYFVNGGELYKGGERFGLGRVKVAESTAGITDMKRGDIVVTGNGAGWVYDGNAWQSVGGDITSLQSSWQTDIKDWVSGLAVGDASTYITHISKDENTGKVTAHSANFANAVGSTLGISELTCTNNSVTVTVGVSGGKLVKVNVDAPAPQTWSEWAAGGSGFYINSIEQKSDGTVVATATSFPTLVTASTDGAVNFGGNNVQVFGWDTVKADISNLQSVVSYSGTGDSIVTAKTGNFTNLNVTDTATFSATTVEATSLTVGGKTIETIANEQISAIAEVEESSESNGITVSVTTAAGSVKTVAVTTTPVAAIATEGDGSNTVVSEKAVKAYVDGKFTALDNAMHFKGVVTELPTENNKGGDIVVIGADPTGNDPSGNKLVQGQEYIYSGTSWELIGDQSTYALNAYAPGDEKVTSTAKTLPSAIHAVAKAVDTLNGEGEGSVKKALVDAKAYTDTEVKKVTDAFTGGENTNGDDGVSVKVVTAAKSAAPTVTVTVTKETLNTTLGTTAVADKTVATTIGDGSDTALATTSAVKAAITAAELVWLDANGAAIA